MADAPAVDAHVHFWDHSVQGLSWAWLEPDFEHPRIRSLAAHDQPRWTGAHLRAEAGDAGVLRVVHVQAARWEGQPELETAWLQHLGDTEGWPDAIVGGVLLRQPDAADHIARHATHGRFRGVRDLTVDEPDDAAVRQAVAALVPVAGSCELMVPVEGFESLARLASSMPEVTFVVGHAGLPLERTEGYRRRWAAGLRRLADQGNVVCKISGLAGALDPQWSEASLRPWVLGCVDAFGPDRCMVGSNWPIDRLYGTYGDLFAAYRSILSDALPAADQAMVLTGTAQRVYRL